MSERKITFNNEDGSSNAISVFGTENTNTPIILISPAMGVEARYYKSLAENLAQYYLVVTADLRGHGDSSVRPSKKVDYGYKEMLDQDFHCGIHTIKTNFPNREIYVLGHSLGGQMASLYAARFPNSINGLILIACCSVYYKGWKGFAAYKTLASTQFIGAIASVLGFFPGKQIGFGGLEGKRVMQDWSHQSRTGNYVVQRDDFNYEKALSESIIKTLVLSFESDTFAPKGAVEHLYKKFHPDAKVKHIHLLGSDPRNDNFNHFNWAKKSDNIVALIKEWM